MAAAPRLLGSRAPSRSMGGGGGHDHTLEPPFQRLPLPNRPLPEEDELIWNDRVAPETALDLDAPHVGRLEGLVMWLGGFAFFYAVYQYAVSTSHPSNKPTVSFARARPGGRIFNRPKTSLGCLPHPSPPILSPCCCSAHSLRGGGKNNAGPIVNHPAKQAARRGREGGWWWRSAGGAFPCCARANPPLSHYSSPMFYLTPHESLFLQTDRTSASCPRRT
jgi:hypothetical protein